jgi:ribosomal-protein-alanine N-acetyltransferase
MAVDAVTFDFAQPGYTPGCRAMQSSDLESVIWIEQSSHAYPWTRGNFQDSLNTGFGAAIYTTPIDRPIDAPQRTAGPSGEVAVVGHWVVMPGFEESHLLNITVARNFRREGWARRMMADVLRWSLHLQRPRVWLEVRESNQAARGLYEAMGFEHISVRKGYYPLKHTRREDAIVMRWQLPEVNPTRLSPQAPCTDP